MKSARWSPRSVRRSLLWFGCFAPLFFLTARAHEDPFDRWEDDIKRFERLTLEAQVDSGGVVFVGSSSIRKWKLDQFFPNKGYLNRGFGGSTIADSTHFSERFIEPLKPSKIVLYAGDNDINQGKSAEQVVQDFKAFVKKVQQLVPGVEVIFISIKPSLKRWELYPEMSKANASIAELCKINDQLKFADIATPMIGNNPQPAESLFVKDQLHLSDKGYEIWTRVLQGVLDIP